MTLAEWRESKGLSLAACAARFGVANGSVVWRWERGIQTPRRHNLRRIFAETAGAVTPNDITDVRPPASVAPAAAPQEVAA